MIDDYDDEDNDDDDDDDDGDDDDDDDDDDGYPSISFKNPPTHSTVVEIIQCVTKRHLMRSDCSHCTRRNPKTTASAKVRAGNSLSSNQWEVAYIRGTTWNEYLVCG